MLGCFCKPPRVVALAVGSEATAERAHAPPLPSRKSIRSTMVQRLLEAVWPTGAMVRLSAGSALRAAPVVSALCGFCGDQCEEDFGGRRETPSRSDRQKIEACRLIMNRAACSDRGSSGRRPRGFAPKTWKQERERARVVDGPIEIDVRVAARRAASPSTTRRRRTLKTSHQDRRPPRSLSQPPAARGKSRARPRRPPASATACSQCSASQRSGFFLFVILFCPRFRRVHDAFVLESLCFLHP